MKTPLLCIPILLELMRVTLAARILAVVPFPSKSHSIGLYSVIRLLANRGHHVSVYSSFPPLHPISNVSYFHVHTKALDITKTWDFEEFKRFINTQRTSGFGINDLWEFGISTSEDTFEDKQIKELLQSEEKYDLVLLEPTVGQESFLVFGHKFKAPVVAYQGFGAWSIGDWVTGNSLSISHSPEKLHFGFSNKMSFAERLLNTISTAYVLFFYHYSHLPKHQRMIEKYYKSRDSPRVEDLLKDVSITLCNSHPTVEYPRPYSPNTIAVGGSHMSSHMTPIPQQIKQFMDDAKEGVIYFSLGTVVPAHILPDEYIQKYVKAFQKVSQRVLWKIELESIPGLPENVMLTKWVPQPTVLAHPHCVLFLTHGGLFSQMEAFHAGVPVVGIPFLADQKYNMRLYEELGMGKQLDFYSSEEEVFETITEVLNNPRFRINAETVSKRIKDQPVSAADSLVFWVEYVLRHKGAEHLRPASAQLRWYQLFLLDVAAASIIALIVILVVMYKVMKLTFHIVTKRKMVPVSYKKNK